MLGESTTAGGNSSTTDVLNASAEHAGYVLSATGGTSLMWLGLTALTLGLVGFTTVSRRRKTI